LYRLPVNVDVKATALKIYPKNQMVSLMKHTVEVMIPEAEIKARIAVNNKAIFVIPITVVKSYN
jgi:hypothetical protein